MDCEKFETTMLDELYDELDELTSAAAKRHVAGCARCASLFGGLRATRRVAVLPIAEPPADLEERILAAARNAQKVVPFRKRVGGAVSTAGRWAMRPQTAMAALFLLMIGSSVLFLRTRQAKAPASSTVTVSQLGEPSPAAASAAPGDKSSWQKGASTVAQTESATGGLLPPAASPRSDGPHGTDGTANGNGVALGALAKDDSRAKAELEEDHARAVARGAPSPTYAYNGPPASMDNAAPYPIAASPAAPPALAASAAAGEPREQQSQQARVGQAQSATFNSAIAAYNAQQYGDAYRMFNGLAANDINAALYAARSLQRVSGCSAAAPRYDDVAQRGSGTRPGWDATFEGGQCYERIGAFDVAREHMRTLLAVPGYAAAAQRELDTMDSATASRRAAPPSQTPQATATASPPAAAPPAAADRSSESY